MSRLQVSLRTAAWALATVGFSLVLNSQAFGQAPTPFHQPVVRAAATPLAPELTAEVNTVVSQGTKLESQRRWGEALALYEDEIRKNPNVTQLGDRIDLAKIHYDLGRRYA